MNRYQAIDYLTEDGRAPLRDRLANLADRQARARIVVRIQRMGAGSLGDGKPSPSSQFGRRRLKVRARTGELDGAPRTLGCNGLAGSRGLVNLVAQLQCFQLAGRFHLVHAIGERTYPGSGPYVLRRKTYGQRQRVFKTTGLADTRGRRSSTGC